MTLRRIITSGQPITDGWWGIAYTYDCGQVAVLYPIGLHLIVAAWYWVGFFIRYRCACRLQSAYQRGWRDCKRHYKI